jgi:hypothetical protein
MMSDKTHIRALVKEAECCRSQGLFLASQADTISLLGYSRENALKKRLSFQNAQTMVQSTLRNRKTPTRILLTLGTLRHSSGIENMNNPVCHPSPLHPCDGLRYGEDRNCFFLDV